MKLHSGGKHHKFGTFNQLSYINGNYIEMLDVEDKEKLKKLAKSEEDAYHLPLRLYKITLFGFKTISLRTNDIEQVKQTLTDRGIDTIGPLRMERDNKKAIKGWQLLYIANPDYRLNRRFSYNGTKAKRLRHLKDFIKSSFRLKQ